MRERNGKAKPKRESKSDWNARPSVSCSPRLPLRLTLLVYPFPPPPPFPCVFALLSFLALKHLCCLILRSCFIFALIAVTLQWLQTCSPSPRIATIRSVNFFILYVIRLVHKPWTFTFSTRGILIFFWEGEEGEDEKLSVVTVERRTIEWNKISSPLSEEVFETIAYRIKHAFHYRYSKLDRFKDNEEIPFSFFLSFFLRKLSKYRWWCRERSVNFFWRGRGRVWNNCDG